MSISRVVILFVAGLISSIAHGQADFKASITEGCTPLKVKFTLDSSSIDVSAINYLTWHFGFGDTINSLDPDTVIYLREGRYTVRLMVNGNRAEAVEKENFIVSHKTVQAGFEWEALDGENTYRFIPLDSITSQTGIYEYFWRYSRADGFRHSSTKVVDYFNQQNAIDTFAFPDTGFYSIRLNISDLNNCSSSANRTLLIQDDFEVANYFMPDVTSFYIINPQDRSVMLKFSVFTRTGALVFEQESPIINWDGRTNAGIDLNTAVYFYILEATKGDPGGRFTKQGFIHLYR